MQTHTRECMHAYVRSQTHTHTQTRKRANTYTHTPHGMQVARAEYKLLGPEFEHMRGALEMAESAHEDDMVCPGLR